MFNYSAVTAGIRISKIEAFLIDVSEELRIQLAKKAKMADVDPSGFLVVASDEEYEALMQATKIYLSNVK